MKFEFVSLALHYGIFIFDLFFLLNTTRQQFSNKFLKITIEPIILSDMNFLKRNFKCHYQSAILFSYFFRRINFNDHIY